jgi:hypothetical protein
MPMRAAAFRPMAYPCHAWRRFAAAARCFGIRPARTPVLWWELTTPRSARSAVPALEDCRRGRSTHVSEPTAARVTNTSATFARNACRQRWHACRSAHRGAIFTAVRKLIRRGSRQSGGGGGTINERL